MRYIGLKFLYSLLIFMYLPKIYPELFWSIVNFISPASFQIFPQDIILLAIFAWAILRRKSFFQGVLKKGNLEHLAFIYLLLGLVAVLVGWLKGSHDLFYEFRFYLYFLLAISIPLILNNSQKLYKFIKFFIIINFLAIIYSLVFIYIPRELSFGYLVDFRFLNLFCISILLALAFNKNKDRFQKIAVGIFLPLSLLALFIDNSRNHYLGLMIAFLIIIFVNFRLILKRKRTFGAFLGIFLLILILGIYTNILSLAYNRLNSSFNLGRDISIDYRIIAIREASKKFLEYPILGTGTGYEFEFCRPVGRTSQFVNFPTTPDQNIVQVCRPWTLHNFHFKALTLGGIIGYGFFWFLVLILLSKAWLAHKKGSILALGIFIGFLTYFIIIFFTVFGMGHFVRLWLFGGLCLAVYNVHINEKNITDFSSRIR